MKNKSEKKICQNCKGEFIIEPDDFSFYEKVKVPPPTFCPECRELRRLAWRNDLTFYNRKCDLTGEPVISLYAPNSSIKVFSPKTWYSDKWDALNYGQEYDFSKTFFKQYSELLNNVPKLSTDTDDGYLSTNCMYTNDFGMSKNCYLVFKAWKLEDVMYSFYAVSSKDLMDVHTSFGKDEGNYETVNTEHCYHSRYIYDSRSCSDCVLCFDCRNCDSCFMCTGLRGKSYCFKNENVGKERYLEIIKEYKLNTYTGAEKAKKEFEPIMQKHPRKALRMVNCQDCLGDLVFNSHDCHYCFVTLGSEHYKYGEYSDGVRDSYDTDAGGGSELVYESSITAFCSRVIGSFYTWHSVDSYYLRHCFRVKDCFGCVGLRDKQYCILNKKYTKEEYFVLLPKIKEHMMTMPYKDSKGRVYTFGDYPPVELSYFPYNDSAAYERLPLTKEKILEENFPFREYHKELNLKDVIRADNLPDDINDVTDDILNKPILSKSSDRLFKIEKEELIFYRKYKIPLPRESFFDRHNKRHKMATSFHLYERQSDKSGEKITSSYPPNASETVWSIDEYKKEFE